MMKKLIITADDLGYSTERNVGIVECYEAGAITRSSLMVNGVAADHACQLARQCGLPLGLHLNLSEGRPLTGAQSLLDSRGLPLGKFGLKEAIMAGTVSMDEVRKEIRAQMDKFTELVGKKPLYVDGHQHVHILPGISEVFAEELILHDVGETRLPVELDLEQCHWMEPWLMEFSLIVCDLAENARKVFEEKGVRFVGMATMSRGMTAERLQSLTELAFTSKAPPPGDSGCTTCELMVHPGYPCKGEGGCGDGADDFSRSEDRPYEMGIIKSQEMLQWYKDTQTQLVSHL